MAYQYITLEEEGRVLTARLHRAPANALNTEFARELFAALRELDGTGVDVILATAIDTAGLGLAVRDRLLRAAEGRVHKC